MNSKILIWSDLHVHPHKRSSERLQHCLDALEWVFKTAIDKKVTKVVFCGDLFHDRQKIDVLTYQRTYEIFEKYLIDKGRPFDLYLLLGNHDLWFLQRWDVSSVNPFRAIPGVTIVDEPKIVDLFHEGDEKAWPVGFLPYTHDPIEDLKKIDTSGLDYKILFGHIAVDGAVWNAMAGTISEVAIEHDGDMVKVDSEIFKNWNEVFLGHYHKEQKLDNLTGTKVEYVGSPLQLNFGEAFQHKHVIIYDLETHEKEYIRNTFSPQHFIISASDIDKYKIEGNFIKILTDDISSPDLIQLRQSLIEKNVGSFEVKPIKKEEDEHLVEDAKAILLKEDEMLEKYVNQVEKNSGLDDLDKSLLLEIGKEICEETK